MRRPIRQGLNGVLTVHSRKRHWQHELVTVEIIKALHTFNLKKNSEQMKIDERTDISFMNVSLMHTHSFSSILGFSVGKRRPSRDTRSSFHLNIQ